MLWLDIILHNRRALAVAAVVLVLCAVCCASDPRKFGAALERLRLDEVVDGAAVARGAQSAPTSGEERCRAFIQRMTGIRFERVRPSWLRNPDTGRALELDMFSPTPRPIAFEFDGQQHARYTPFYHETVRDFEAGQRRDRTKERLCVEHGVELIRIPPDVHDQPEAFVYEHLLRLGLVRAPAAVLRGGAAAPVRP